MISTQRLVQVLLAKWSANACLQEAAKAEARRRFTETIEAELGSLGHNSRNAGSEIERVIEEHIDTTQAEYLLEFMWVLNAKGVANKRLMEEWIDRHNARVAEHSAELALADFARLARVQPHQLLEGALRERMVALQEAWHRVAACRDRMSGEIAAPLLDQLQAAAELTQVLMSAKLRSDGHSLQQLVQRLGNDRDSAPWLGSRRERKLRRISKAYFGGRAKRMCCERQDGAGVVLSLVDLQRFMAEHMDESVCKDRLLAMADAGLLLSERQANLRLFRLTDRAAEIVADALAMLDSSLGNGDAAAH